MFNIKEQEGVWTEPGIVNYRGHLLGIDKVLKVWAER